MIPKPYRRGLCLLLFLSCFGRCFLPAADAPPNLVFILADDLGWSDTTLYGTTALYETPNIERLAKRGMLLTNAYAASPICSPTRASIMTGLEPARLGITQPSCHEEVVRLEASLPETADPGRKAIGVESATRLRTEYLTLAETLKAAGYATGHFGKWHLGKAPYSPLEQGFDVDIPHWHHAGPGGSYVAPWPRFTPEMNFKPRTPDEHIEDRMADEAVAFLRAHKDRPFFLNYWAFSVHSPFDAKPALVEKYRTRIDPESPQRSAIYAAMVESLDDAVGTLLDELDALGLADNTIIVFYSDNGGNMYNRPEGVSPTSNAPLRGGKGTLYEGGIRVPGAVVWPGLIAAGSRSDALFGSTDFYPTLLAMLEIDAPADAAFDGVDQWPMLQGGAPVSDTLFSYYPHYTPATGHRPGIAVRKGDWKLIRFFHDAPRQDDLLELYHLTEDIGERRNVAASEPGRVGELNRMLDAYLAATGAVVPVANPSYMRDR